MAIARGKVQRRAPARQTAAGDSAAALIGRFAASANGAPVVVVLGVHVGVGIDERSDDSAIAVVRRKVQRGAAIPVCARRGRGAGVGPTGVPQSPTGTRKQSSTLAPRVDYVVVLGNR